MFGIYEVTEFGLIGDFTGKTFATYEEAQAEADRMEKENKIEYCVWKQRFQKTS